MEVMIKVMMKVMKIMTIIMRLSFIITIEFKKLTIEFQKLTMIQIEIYLDAKEYPGPLELKNVEEHHTPLHLRSNLSG
jgi:hypothetical protein